MQVDAPPIRIALLGADAATPEIARAIAADRRYEFAGACELDEAQQDVIARSLGIPLAGMRHFDAWEALLDRDQADVVVVVRGDDEDRRAEQLRKLIQTEVPVVASHPVVGSMLVYYELDMIRRETESIVLPYLPDRHHPALAAIRAMIAQGTESPIGRIEQVIVQRRLARLDKTDVLAQFARDVDVMRSIAGDMTRLGAMAGTREAGGYAGLGVQMSGPSAVVARWSVDSIVGARQARLEVLGTHGKAVLEMTAAPQPWSLELTSAGKTETTAYDAWDSAAAVLDQLQLTLAGESMGPDWVDAARSVELAETIDRSLQKGRTIELYYEDYTEQGTFKGTMTSIGCGLLVLALGLMGAVAITDQLGLPPSRLWAYLLAGGLGLFLLLQLLMLVFRKDESREPD